MDARLPNNLQESSVDAGSVLQQGLRVFPGDLAVEPGHLLMGRGGDELLQLRPLADDGLFQLRLL